MQILTRLIVLPVLKVCAKSASPRTTHFIMASSLSQAVKFGYNWYFRALGWNTTNVAPETWVPVANWVLKNHGDIVKYTRQAGRLVGAGTQTREPGDEPFRKVRRQASSSKDSTRDSTMEDDPKRREVPWYGAGKRLSAYTRQPPWHKRY